MSKVLVYQWTKYDIATDNSIRSRRWGTKKGIECSAVLRWKTQRPK
jgi:hypothetical protein